MFGLWLVLRGWVLEVSLGPVEDEETEEDETEEELDHYPPLVVIDGDGCDGCDECDEELGQ